VGALLLPVVLVFVRLSRLFEATGGPILYAQTAFGPGAAFHVGWLQCLSTLASCAANTNLLADYVVAALPGGAGPQVRTGIMLVVLFVVLAINLGRNTRSGRAIGLVTLLKVTPLLILLWLALPQLIDHGL